ncbi:hypothetical protein CIG19_10295 [Enterobacterales bacterium CwR94]|nr:hypothetical protein CIG19_10295 [Enterobacterales bacterium CwR94]
MNLHTHPYLLTFLLSATLFTPAWVHASPKTAEEVETVSSDKTILLETLSPSPLSMEFSVLATLQQDPRYSATLSSRLDGWVSAVNVLPGKNVKEGDILATVESPQLHDERRAVMQTQAALQAATVVLQRKQKMMKEEIISRNELTAATLDWQQAKAAFEAAQSRLLLLGTDARSTSSTVAVKAPFTGTIMSATLRQKQAVTPADVLFTLSDLTKIQVIAQVPESQIRYLTTGAAVRIQSSAWPDTSFNGKVVNTAGTLDPVSRTLAVHIEVDNQRARLKPEMLVSAKIHYTSPTPVFSVPHSALTLIEGKPAVFVAIGGETYQPVNVTTGREGIGRTEITAGLKAGDAVVVDQTYDLKSRLLIAETAGGH